MISKTRNWFLPQANKHRKLTNHSSTQTVSTLEHPVKEKRKGDIRRGMDAIWHTSRRWGQLWVISYQVRIRITMSISTYWFEQNKSLMAHGSHPHTSQQTLQMPDHRGWCDTLSFPNLHTKLFRGKYNLSSQTKKNPVWERNLVTVPEIIEML